jgi:allantoinase
VTTSDLLADPRNRIFYSPITTRPPITWPGGARVAFWVSPNVEHYEYRPPGGQAFSIFTRVPTPDVQQYGLRDFGNRVGFWRMADVLDRYEVKVTVSLNVAVLDHYPEIRDAMVDRRWAFMSHGVYNTRPIYEYTEDEERAFYADTVATIARHTGQDLKGMLGPTLSSTVRTPDLMAEAGLEYSADWPLDDQPVPILTRSGRRLVSVPYSFDHNDANPTLAFDLEPWADRCIAQFDRLWQEGEQSGRVMCVALHPFVVGQPHLVGHLSRVLEHVRSHEGVWYATADEIAAHYLAHHYDAHIAHATERAAPPTPTAPGAGRSEA